MLTNISIDNFRAIKSIKIDNMKPIIGLWGPNGCGKSTVLHSQVLMRNFAEMLRDYDGRTNVNEYLIKNGINFNGFQEITHKRMGAEIIIHQKFSNGNYNHLHLLNQKNVKFQNKNISYKEKLRYFPPNRLIFNREAPPKARLSKDFALNTPQIHSYIHWFIHDKLYEKDGKTASNFSNELDRVNFWAERFGYGKIVDKQQLNGDVSGLFVDKYMDSRFHLMDGGHGGNTFLPILLEAYSFKDGILLIEEPEISLHPGSQSEAIDFFIEIAQDRGHQIIFTSHSEYMLRKIVRKYRKKEISKDLVQILACDKDENGTIIDNIELDWAKETFEKNGEVIPKFTTRFEYNYQ